MDSHHGGSGRRRIDDCKGLGELSLDCMPCDKITSVWVGSRVHAELAVVLLECVGRPFAANGSILEAREEEDDLGGVGSIVGGIKLEVVENKEKEAFSVSLDNGRPLVTWVAGRVVGKEMWEVLQVQWGGVQGQAIERWSPK